MNKAFINTGLFYGDENKGTTVEFQTKKTNSKLTVRFNGGAQAAHNIVLKDGRHHTFSSFGAATFEPGVKTYLSEFMLVNPLAMESEEAHLASNNVHDAFNRMHINRNCLVTTPYHRADNRIKELFRGGNMHGSCGMGISATVEDSINRPDECLRIQDLENDGELLRKLKLNRLAMIDSCKNYFIAGNPLMENEMGTFDEDLIDVIFERFKAFREKVAFVDMQQAAKLFDETETVVFEPAQGILLDENYGFHPYTTWTTCTLKNAQTILKNLNFKGDVFKFGVMRAFGTRHGPGPFVTEDAELTKTLADPYNTLNIWQKGFRCGFIDFVALDYSLRVNGRVDFLSVSHLDWISSKLTTYQVCVKYQLDGVDWIPPIPTSLTEQEELTKNIQRVVPVYEHFEPTRALMLIESKLNTPISIVGNGPKYEDRYLYRNENDMYSE